MVCMSLDRAGTRIPHGVKFLEGSESAKVLKEEWGPAEGPCGGALRGGQRQVIESFGGQGNEMRGSGESSWEVAWCDLCFNNVFLLPQTTGSLSNSLFTVLSSSRLMWVFPSSFLSRWTHLSLLFNQAPPRRLSRTWAPHQPLTSAQAGHVFYFQLACLLCYLITEP